MDAVPGASFNETFLSHPSRVRFVLPLLHRVSPDALLSQPFGLFIDLKSSETERLDRLHITCFELPVPGSPFQNEWTSISMLY